MSKKYVFTLSRPVTIEEVIALTADNKLQAVEKLESGDEVEVLDWQEFGRRNRNQITLTEVFDEDGIPEDESL